MYTQADYSSHTPQGLRIGQSIEAFPPVALAPMVGVSHSALRTLLTELGGVGLFYTEMLAAKRLPHENEKVSPFLIRGPEERPLIHQIFISDQRFISGAVQKLEEIAADGIDINLGCPAPQVRRSGAGGYLAEDVRKVRTIVSTLRESTNLPFTAKIRLGTTLDRSKLIDFCSMLEGEGVDAITVHARLHGEKFCRPPRWEWVQHVKGAVNIPVLANGGIFTVDQARRCLEVSGADGLMLGRGGVENPMLFAEISEEIYGVAVTPDHTTKSAIYRRFVELLELRFPPERRLGRLKEFTHYFSRSYKFGHHFATAVQKSRSVAEAQDISDQFFDRSATS